MLVHFLFAILLHVIYNRVMSDEATKYGNEKVGKLVTTKTHAVIQWDSTTDWKRVFLIEAMSPEITATACTHARKLDCPKISFSFIW